MPCPRALHSDTLASALEGLRRQLEDVNRRLAEVAGLQVRRQRVLKAIQALEALDSPVEEMMATVGSWTESMKQMASRADHMAEPEPDSPIEAAVTVLSDVGFPLHISRLIGLMQARGWYRERSYESLRGTLASALDRMSRAGEPIWKPEPATYALTAWGVVIDEGAGRVPMPRLEKGWKREAG